MRSLPLAGGPLDNSPTLFFLAFSLICFRITSAPGKSASARRLLPSRERWKSQKKYFAHRDKDQENKNQSGCEPQPARASGFSGSFLIRG